MTNMPTCLIFETTEALIEAADKLDDTLIDRRRNKDEREWWLVISYAISALDRGNITFPLSICKVEADPPDFIVCWADQAIPIETVYATSEDYEKVESYCIQQKDDSRPNRSYLINNKLKKHDNEAIIQPKINTTHGEAVYGGGKAHTEALIIETIEAKVAKYKVFQNFKLVVYVNSPSKPYVQPNVIDEIVDSLRLHTDWQLKFQSIDLVWSQELSIPLFEITQIHGKAGNKVLTNADTVYKRKTCSEAIVHENLYNPG